MNAEQASKPVDPFETLREVRDTYLDAMSKVMIKAVNSEEYAQASGALLEGYLSMAGPVREAVDKAMAPTLEQLSLPSRQQVIALAERLTNMEMRLDDMDAKLDCLLGLLSVSRPAAAGTAPEVRQAESTEEKSGQ